MVTIDVTQEDIDNGVPRSTCKCPIALAARRVLGRDDLEVLPNGIALGVIWQDGLAILPKEAKRFMGAFDAIPGKPSADIAPFSFEADFRPASPLDAITFDK